jgi:TetR/AcrR family transcriptional regulator
MGIAERKEREKEQRRQAIIKAGKKVISKLGVDGMSMNMLAESTELNKATLYLYFSSKDDLIDAIVYEGLLLLEKKFQEIDRHSISGLEKVLNLVDATLTFYKEYPVYFYAMNHQERRPAHERLETPFATKGNEAASRLFEKIKEGLRQGIEAGSIRKEIDVNTAIILIYAHTFGVMHTVHAKEDVYKDVLNVDPGDIEKSALESIEYYLRKGN